MNELSSSDSGGTLFVVSAPSGAGKTSLVRALLEAEPSMGVAVSHTTRTMRPEEQDGVNYHFVDTNTFKQLADRGGFIEWANVFGNLYGTSIDAANLVLDAGKNLILEIDWQGAAQVRQKFMGTQSIFIFPPSLAALRQRLEGRGQDDADTVQKRMDSAFQELSHWREFDYLIVNDDFDEALKQLTSVVNGQGNHLLKSERQAELKPLISELLPREDQ
ncbi:MAG: guanylate kinase [Pseudomonadales bacterium]|jgi:guanylate kinase|nr:guanylate kinase [Pseudomonadales bacterium]